MVLKSKIEEAFNFVFTKENKQIKTIEDNLFLVKVGNEEKANKSKKIPIAKG